MKPCRHCGNTERKHRACPTCSRRRNAAWRANNKAKTRSYNREYLTGWSQEAFDAAWSTQGGRCAICNCEMQPEGSGRTAVNADHCHATKQPRGLLCWDCNVGIGKFHDNPERLQAAANYLSRWSG